MFGKINISKILSIVVLVGFSIYILKLFLSEQINLYIHPRYSIFAAIMSAISLIILLIGLVLYIRRPGPRSGQVRDRVKALDIVVLALLVLAFVLPAKPLSSRATDRKSLNTPSSSVFSIGDKGTCPTEAALAIEAWVSQIAQYAPHCFEGQNIKLSGFVYESEENKLPEGYFYLGRMVMSCCVIDARPYALPIEAGDMPMPKDGEWFEVKGRLKLADLQNKMIVVVEVDTMTPTTDPTQPYEFYNTPAPRPQDEVRFR